LQPDPQTLNLAGCMLPGVNFTNIFRYQAEELLRR
jgi:hypothetical protein